MSSASTRESCTFLFATSEYVAVLASDPVLHRIACVTYIKPKRLVTPGMVPSPHLHQIVGGNALAPRMDHPDLNITATATCTTCTFTEDLSNYWTAVLFFWHRNGSYHRVPLMGNLGLEGQRGGMTVYYTAPYDKKTKVTAFKPV